MALALCGMLVAPDRAHAIADQGCAPNIVEGAVVSGDAGTVVQFSIEALQPGADPCSIINYSVTEVIGSDTTSGVTLQGTGFGNAFFNSTPSVESVNMPSTPFGGGSITYRVTCTDGCMDVPLNSREVDVTVQVNNYVEIYDNSGSFQSAPTGFAFTNPLEAFVRVNGNTAAAGTPVIFTANTEGLELDGGGLANTVTDDNGLARVTAVPNAGADVVHSATATTPNVSVDSANFSNLQEVATGQALILLSSVPTTGFVGQVIPVSVRALIGGVPDPGVGISWEFQSPSKGCDFSFGAGPGDFSPSANVTDINGTSTSQLTLTGTGQGCGVIRIAIAAKGAGAKGGLPSVTEVRFAINVTPNYSLDVTPGFSVSQTVRPGDAAALSVDLQQEVGGVFEPVGSSEFISYEMASAPDANWNFEFNSPGQSSFVSTDINGSAATTLTASTLGSYAVKAKYNGSLFLLDKVTGSPPLEVLFNVLVQNEIVLVDDDFSGQSIDATNGGSTPSVITNDQFNGLAMTSQDVVLSIINNGGLAGASINPNGEILVPGPSAGGSFTITYQACDALDGANCEQGMVSVQVDATPILAVADDFTGTPIDADAGGTTSSVLDNDLLNNEPIFPSEVNVSILNGGGLTPGGNLFLGSDGTLNIVPPVAAGTYTVAYQICEALNSFNCSSSTANLSIIGGVVRALLADAGNEQSGQPGSTPQPLVVLATDDGVPASNVVINWSLTGPATIATAQTTTDTLGRSSNTITFTDTPGSVTVTARRSDDNTVFATFILTSIEAGQPRLIIKSGNLQTGIAGTRADQPLVAQVLGGQGLPLIGETIEFEVLSGGAIVDAASVMTDGNGNATVGFVFGPTPSAVEIEVRSEFHLQQIISTHIATGALVNGIGGNNQSGPAGSVLELDFEVLVAPDVVKALGGVSVDWEVLSGGGSLRDAVSTTDTNGVARNRLTLGPVPGVNIVQATLPGGATVQFRADGLAVGAVLTKVSGDNQTIPTNDPSAPLVVRLADAAGNPIQGARVNWSAEQNAVVDPEFSITDASGQAQTVAQVLAPGAASVSASTAELEADEVVFAFVGGVRNIDILNPDERDVGAAVDALCPALGALPSRTPEEEDLFQRCSEFVDNAGDNPDEVRTALGELPPDIGSTISDSGQSGLDAQFDNINTRFLMLHDEQRGGKRNQFNVGLWTPTGMLPLSMLSSLAGEGEDAASEAGIDFDRWGFFATGTIGRGESDQTSNRPRFDYDIVGLTAGVDYRFKDSLIGGFALGITDNDVKIANNGGNLDTKGWSASAYLSWFSQSQWYVDGAVSYGSNDYDIRRAVSYSIRALDGSRTTVDQVASASTDGTQLGTSISVGRDWQKGAWNINSYLRGSVRRIDYDGYQERMIAGLPGQGLALIVDGRSSDSITTALGAKATYVLSRDWGVLMPTASVEWEHEYEDDVQLMVSRFAFDPTATPIIQNGDEVDTDYFNVGVGISAIFPGGKSAYLYYEQLVGSSNLTQGILSIGGRIEF